MNARATSTDVVDNRGTVSDRQPERLNLWFGNLFSHYTGIVQSKMDGPGDGPGETVRSASRLLLAARCCMSIVNSEIKELVLALLTVKPRLRHLSNSERHWLLVHKPR